MQLTSPCLPILLAGALAVAGPACAGEIAPQQPAHQTLQDSPAADVPDATDLDWKSLDWNAPSLVDHNTAGRWAPPASPSTGGSTAVWDRKDKTDGTTAVTVKKQLPTPFDAKVGVDMGLAQQPITIRPEDIASGTRTTDTSVAWANMTLSGASIDARLNPQLDQATLGTTFRKSVPVGSAVAVTLQNGYSVTDTYANSSVAPLPGLMALPPGSAMTLGRVYTTDGQARLSVLSSDTTLITGTKLTSSDEKWLRSVGAEQKLFGGVNISGTISETATRTLDKSFSAGFKTSW